MSFERIENIQTRDTYYNVYKATNWREWDDGYYFFEDELIMYYGPFNSLDVCCKKAAAVYRSVMSL
jgi:hypothetical protein